MKIVLTGAAGNISKPLAERLLAAGHEVSIVGRNEEKLRPLTQKGAKALIGHIEDRDFIVSAFRGADAVYTMVPVPYHLADNWVAFHELVAENYAEGIIVNGVKKVVNLGTYGGHYTKGIGPTAAIGRVEAILGAISDVDFIPLRPGYFYTNFLSQIPSIKASGIIGGNYGNTSNKLLLSHYLDIAEAAFEALTTPHFNNNEPYYPISDIRDLEDTAAVLGKAIGKDNWRWIPFTDDDTRNGMLNAGFPLGIAEIYVEIGQYFARGILNEHYESLPVKPRLYNVKLETFAEEFAAAYQQQ